MSTTKHNGPEQTQPGTITRSLLNTVTTGSAVIAKILAGAGVILSSTGVDAGTGDVTVSALSNLPNTRLTLASGTPVMAAAVAAAAAVYCTPYGGNTVPQWNGTVFVDSVFAEVSQALSDTTKSPSAAVASMGYDVFGWYDSGVFRATRGPAWTAGATAGTWTAGGGTCARGQGAGSTQLTRVQGIAVNQFAITNGPAAGFGVFLGSIATDSSGATVSWSLGSAASGGGAAVLNVWNMYNRVDVSPLVVDTAGNHTYATATLRAFGGSNSDRITFMSGLAEEGLSALFAVLASGAAANSASSVSIGVDTTTTYGGTRGYATHASSGAVANLVASLPGYAPQLGQHYLQCLEIGDGTNANTYLATAGQMSFGGRFRM